MNDGNLPRKRRKLDDLQSLTAESLANIIDDNCRVRYTLINDEGMIEIVDGREREIAATVGMAITDTRIVFATSAGGGHIKESIDFRELVGITVDGTNTVELTNTEGSTWRFTIPYVEPDTMDVAINHLRWIGQIRRQLTEMETDVEMTAGEIRTLADEREWEAAREQYEQMRHRLDELINAIQLTEPIEDTVLAPELTSIARTLEKAHVRLYIDRAKSELELGEYLVTNEDYDQVNAVLQRAHEYYEIARQQSVEVERGDSFEFGEQRELKRDLQSLGWELETIAAEPVRQAHEAKILAQTSDSPDETLEYWETVYDRFSRVLALEGADQEGNFVGDITQIREERLIAANELVDLYTKTAREDWNEGVRDHQDGSIKRALQRCSSAYEKIDRAVEIASDIDHEDRSALELRLEKMEETVRTLRNTRSSNRESSGERTARPTHSTTKPADTDPESTGGRAAAETETAESSEEVADETDQTLSKTDRIPSVRDITSMDSHHEITLDLGSGSESKSEAVETDESAEERSEEKAEESMGNEDEDSDARAVRDSLKSSRYELN